MTVRPGLACALWALVASTASAQPTSDDELILREFAYDEDLCRWIRLARERVAFQGLPSRICWFGYGERARFGLMINEMVASGDWIVPRIDGHGRAGCEAQRSQEDAVLMQ